MAFRVVLYVSRAAGERLSIVIIAPDLLSTEADCPSHDDEPHKHSTCHDEDNPSGKDTQCPDCADKQVSEFRSYSMIAHL